LIGVAGAGNTKADLLNKDYPSSEGNKQKLTTKNDIL
jgi:hypothetical protein